MSDLFKKKNSEDKRDSRIPVRFTKAELEQVKNSAKIRNLDTADFLRRAALGRKADVRFDTQIVLEVHQLVQELRRVYKICQETGRELPVEMIENMSELIKQSGEALQRIQK